MVSVDPMPTEQEVQALYSAPEYFEEDYDCGLTRGSYFENKAAVLRRQNQALEIFERLCPRRGAFLEVGCAGGFFLEQMQKMGWDATGLELSGESAAFARKMGLKVLSQDLGAAKFESGAFNAVLMGDVLEHVVRPLEFLRETYRVMAPGGVLVVKTPAFVNSVVYRTITIYDRLRYSRGRSPFLAMLKIPRHQVDLRPPYHVYEYNASCLRLLLGRCGFEVASVNRRVPLPDAVVRPARHTPKTLMLAAVFLSLDWMARFLRLPLGSLIVVARKN